MAEASFLASTIDKNYLECSICTGPFDDPRALPCLHPFCCGCLEKWAKACSKDGKIVSCPLCKKIYQVPEEEGIKGFPAHFLVADLQSTVDKAKQKHSTLDLCENHGEKKIYYCENCNCTACSDCGILDPTHRGHTFIRLKQAALQQSRSLEDLARRVRDVKEKYKSAVQQAQQVEHDLDYTADAKIKATKEAGEDFLKQSEDLIKAYEQKVCHNREEKRRAVHQQIDMLQSDLAAITSSYELVTNVIESGSHSDIISLYPSLSSSLQQLIQSQPCTVDNTLSQIQLEPIYQQTYVDMSSLEQLICDKLQITRHLSTTPTVTADISAAAAITTTEDPSPRSSSANPFPTSTATAKSLPSSATGRPQATRERESSRYFVPVPSEFEVIQRPRLSSGFWNESGRIKTAPQTRYPYGIAIHQNGDFAVTSISAPVTVFSSIGQFKHVIKGSPSGIYDIAISSYNQYIIPGKDGSNEFYIYDSQGVLLRTIPTYNINNQPSTPSSVAVDSTGRIIVGFSCRYWFTSDKTVSIHQPYGTLISKFETKSSPRRLICTPHDRLISFDDNTLQVMDKSGDNASIIQPPSGIQSWVPWYMCCSKQGELFVCNTLQLSNPSGVFRYVSIDGEYKCLDCITTRWKPYGIALSADEEKLIVVDHFASAIKIFQWQSIPTHQ